MADLDAYRSAARGVRPSGETPFAPGAGAPAPGPRRLGGLGGIAAALVALAAVALAPQAARAASSCPGDMARAVTELLNRERLAAGVPPVEVDVRLVAAAERHSEDMAEGGFLSHTGSDGSTAGERVREAGYDSPSGEIAGYGFSTAEGIVQAWMDSSSHRRILLREESRHVGVGYAPGDGLTRHYYTANFGKAEGPPASPELSCEPPEPTGTPSCDDGVDADADGLVDFPEDPGCATASQSRESDPRCGLGFELAFLLPALGAARRWRRARRAA